MRECSDKELNKRRRCYLADIDRCYAPCTEPDIKPQYVEELERVNDFLCGNNQSAVDRLLNRMKELSSKQKYEEAGEIRDVVNSILNQLNKSSILAEPINQANVLIEILGARKNDYMLLLDGKMYLKNYVLNEKDQFDDILNGFFAGDIQLIKELTEKDLEYLRIALSWLVKNRNRIKVHYLKDYQSIEQLGPNFIFTNK